MPLIPDDPDCAVRPLREHFGSDPETSDARFFGDAHEWAEEMVMPRFDPATVVARTPSYEPAPGVRDAAQ